MGCGGSKPEAAAAPTEVKAQNEAAEAIPKLDPQIPFTYREFFTLKNYWKSIRRNEADCGKAMLAG
jgi:hypothetical protein